MTFTQGRPPRGTTVRPRWCPPRLTRRRSRQPAWVPSPSPPPRWRPPLRSSGRAPSRRRRSCSTSTRPWVRSRPRAGGCRGRTTERRGRRQVRPRSEANRGQQRQLKQAQWRSPRPSRSSPPTQSPASPPYPPPPASPRRPPRSPRARVPCHSDAATSTAPTLCTRLAAAGSLSPQTLAQAGRTGLCTLGGYSATRASPNTPQRGRCSVWASSSSQPPQCIPRSPP
mmetsp:Transcript_35662/g.69869  ORF Transcript_35662/g.69869 Transcript_35662/m.69869 type:complete len:226 (+) Transcript_35662:359-1036(+)